MCCTRAVCNTPQQETSFAWRYITGLAAFAQQGAERVLDIINAEFRLAMIGCGTTTLKAITPPASSTPPTAGS
jgi:isopentenyl diphosphate isomerase/L-lactate dehydrogenase-like FMN-dependent dehydrogenase